MAQVPLHIALDDSVPSQARETIESAARELEQYHARITSCRVAVSAPDHRHREGGLFDVHITVRVPHHADIVVSHRAGEKHEREHLDVAIRRAFHEARRQLQDSARESRLDVKSHVPTDHGRVARLFRDEGYGFIEASDGHELYFHRNSVADGKFDHLRAGSEVRFVETEGEKGLQASTVSVIGKHHLD